MPFYHSAENGGGRGIMMGLCLVNIGDTPDLGVGVISALSFRRTDVDSGKLPLTFSMSIFSLKLISFFLT